MFNLLIQMTNTILVTHKVFHLTNHKCNFKLLHLHIFYKYSQLTILNPKIGPSICNIKILL